MSPANNLLAEEQAQVGMRPCLSSLHFERLMKLYETPQHKPRGFALMRELPVPAVSAGLAVGVGDALEGLDTHLRCARFTGELQSAAF